MILNQAGEHDMKQNSLTLEYVPPNCPVTGCAMLSERYKIYSLVEGGSAEHNGFFLSMILRRG